jgi:hypothetical protein
MVRGLGEGYPAALFFYVGGVIAKDVVVYAECRDMDN